MDLQKVYSKQLKCTVGERRTLYKDYIAMTEEEIDKYIDMIVADKATDMDEKQIGSLLYLALYSYGCGEKLPQKYYDYLFQEEVFYPGQLYLRAGEEVLDKLIEKIESVGANDTLQINHLLTCIAAIPCEKSAKFLQDNSKDLPLWARKLHIKPEEYSKEMGWEVTKESGVRKLFSEEITAFAPSPLEPKDELAPLMSQKQICRFCKQPLSLVYSGEHDLAGCLHCSCYQTVFTKEIDEEIVWHPKNKEESFFQKYPQYMKSDEDVLQGIDYALQKTKEARKATYTANEFTEIKRSQLGGLPTGINDIKYPKCPDCGKVMPFYGQLDMSDIVEYGEGLYYFFYCEDCKVCGCNFDQS